MLSANTTCPCCHVAGGQVFHRVERTPANSCLLIPLRSEALDFPCGELALASCEACGFIWNATFDPGLTVYSERYEETQGFSPTFGRFQRRLAQDLVEQFELRGKRILEIGCGKGEFLALLCELADNSGVGFDPAYREGRLAPEALRRLTFIRDLYSENYSAVGGDFICCLMTLEHMISPATFVATLRRALANNPAAVVFVMVPDAGRILTHGAFEDIYYEHCSYFTRTSLGRLFQTGGFEVLSVESVYDRQYLALAGRPAGPEPVAGESHVADLAELQAAVASFQARCAANRRNWQERIDRWGRDGCKVVLWGSGSKAVGFLTAVQAADIVEYVVDINPHKAGTFMAGTGQEIVAPDYLLGYQPDVVVIMNAIYRQEIAGELLSLGLQPQLQALR